MNKDLQKNNEQKQSDSVEQDIVDLVIERLKTMPPDASLSVEEKKQAAQLLGRLGGLASAKKLTKKQRIERAKKAVAAREAKKNHDLNQVI